MAWLTISVIVKREQFELVRQSVTRAELREQLIELWAQVFERELRADLDAEAEASGERARLRAIQNAPMHCGALEEAEG